MYGLLRMDREKHKAYCRTYNLLHREERKAYFKANHQSYKEKVFDHYGWVCACCEEAEPLFLTIDHVNNDGAEHREKIGGSGSLYLWLIRNNFPEGFQTLCRNCNWAKQFGVCPHKLEVSEKNTILNSITK